MGSQETSPIPHSSRLAPRSYYIYRIEMALGVALVTGAARGIGRAIALRLAKDGFNVAVNDIGHQDQLASLQDEIRALGRDSIECIADVSKDEDVKCMIAQTVERLGSLDVVSTLSIVRC
jgi:NAD(P)-dependent dehydrogenase (short-subunit alcohol dehydrogenase family)